MKGSRGAGCWLKASVGIEPTNKGFADPRLTTWQRRQTGDSLHDRWPCVNGTLPPIRVMLTSPITLSPNMARVIDTQPTLLSTAVQRAGGEASCLLRLARLHHFERNIVGIEKVDRPAALVRPRHNLDRAIGLEADAERLHARIFRMDVVHLEGQM